MLRSRSFLGVALAAALLAGCGDQTHPLAPTAESEPLLANGASQGLIRMTFPGDFPGVPGYARIEDLPPHVYIVDGWAVIAVSWQRSTDCWSATPLTSARRSTRTPGENAPLPGSGSRVA
jgi:hypothetical protein